ncbi:MAG: hypothetical protein JXQ83_10000, partial [Candidatus Glassbacteria bacterium]|nr:hypothetical protein [Candidatus Glassbacteria bacterium]
GLDSIYHGRPMDLSEGGFALEEGSSFPPGEHEVRLHAGNKGFVGIGLLELQGGHAGCLRPKRLILEAFPFE